MPTDKQPTNKELSRDILRAGTRLEISMRDSDADVRGEVRSISDAWGSCHLVFHILTLGAILLLGVPLLCRTDGYHVKILMRGVLADTGLCWQDVNDAQWKLAEIRRDVSAIKEACKRYLALESDVVWRNIHESDFIRITPLPQPEYDFSITAEPGARIRLERSEP